MLVVVDLDGGVDAAADADVFDGAIPARDAEGEVLLWLQVRIEADDVVGLGAVEFERLGGGAFLELEGEDAHADEVAAVDALEALGDDDLDAEQVGALGGPITA